MKIKILFVLIVITASLWGNTIKAAGDLDWYTDYKSALDEAKKTNSFVLLNFTGSDWCSWCKELDKNVFSTNDFKLWQGENAVLLHLDFPQKLKLSQKQIDHNRQLAFLYGITGFPTILILNSNGELIARTGYMPTVNEWLASTTEHISKYNEVIKGQ